MRLLIGNETGHTVMENVQVDEMLDHLQEHPTHWVYLDGLQKARESITASDWDTVTEVKLMPGMVGGQE